MCHVANGNLGHVVHMPDELRRIRKREAENAAKIIGAEEITLDVGDMMVNSYCEDTLNKMVRVIRETKPNLIITHHIEDYMKDHMETSQLVFNASFGSSIPHFGAGSAVYGKIVPIFYMDTVAGINFVPTEYVDISETIEIKLSALSQHESQIKWMLEHDHIDFLEFTRTCSKYRGLQCSVPYAEGFRQCLAWPRATVERLLP